MKKPPMKKPFVRFVLVLLLIVLLVVNPLSTRLMTLGVALASKLEPAYFYRLIKAESSFLFWAHSHKDAIGLGQIREETARYMFPGCPRFLLWLPPVNLHISAVYLKYLMKRYNSNWSIALAAYNWGETNVDRTLRQNNITINTTTDYRYLFANVNETSGYLDKILK